jgi:hypothetical protein
MSNENQVGMLPTVDQINAAFANVQVIKDLAAIQPLSVDSLGVTAFPKVDVTIREPDTWSVAPSNIQSADEKLLEEKLKIMGVKDILQIIAQAEKRKDYFLNRIVCAANYFPGMGMLIAPRHWDETMHRAYERLEAERNAARVLNPELEELPAGHKFAEGFIDKFGKWHTREEAWVIAEAAGQIIRRVGGDTTNGGRLFSENLY